MGLLGKLLLGKKEFTLPPRFALVEFTPEARRLGVEGDAMKEINAYAYGDGGKRLLFSWPYHPKRVKILESRSIPVVDLTRETVERLPGEGGTIRLGRLRF